MKAKGYQDRDHSFMALAEYIAFEKRGLVKQGLLLTGTVGSGKTTFLNLFLRCFTTASIHKAQGLSNLFMRENEEFMRLIYPDSYQVLPDCYWDFAIDDLGQEDPVNYYGVKQEVLEQVLSARYDAFKAHGGRTFLSTNLDMQQLKHRYGDRIESRLHEMCVVVPFNAQDYRKGGR